MNSRESCKKQLRSDSYVRFFYRLARQPGIPDPARRVNQFTRGEADGSDASTHAIVGGAAVQVGAEDERRFTAEFLR